VEDFPAGEVWHEDAPDFRIYTPTQIVGIEHCLLHIPSTERTPLQAIENQIDEIIACAKEHAELRGMPPIQAKFLFRHYSALQKVQRIDLARKMARTVYDLVLEMDKTQPYIRTMKRRSEDSRIPDPIELIDIRMLPKESSHFWFCARSGWESKDGIHIFQSAIDKKSKHYQSYLRECQECWIVMVAEMKPSSFIRPNQDTLDHIYTGPFDRVYFMAMAENLIHRLKVEKGRSSKDKVSPIKGPCQQGNKGAAS